ncbi:CPBP family glutamic-type intramembrane protease [Micromonospora sp. NPDC048842]|uniref:CPBP family glutamic-type intramembrane protease n=1 Tax=unclassified Micromonospora TaxID=2617518 RepID=UPI0033EB517E
MTESVVLAVVGLLFGALFIVLRTRAYPTEPMPPVMDAAAATDQAAATVRRLCGLDVTGWRSFAVLHFDGIVDRLHHLGLVARQREFLNGWGLQGSWRVRFIGADGSVLVGLSPRGDVVLFELAGDLRGRVLDRVVPARPGDGTDRGGDGRVAPGTGDDKGLRQRLGVPDGVWAGAEPVGAGYWTREDESTERTRRFRATSPDVRIEFEVESLGATVLRVDSLVELTNEQIPALERAEQREVLAGAGALLGSVLALVGGVALLAFAGGTAQASLAAVLAVPVLLAVLFGEGGRFRYTAVHGYEGTQSWASFRAINALTSAVTAVTMSAVVVVAALAGSLVAQRVGMPTTSDLGRQVIWGACLAAIWLGLAAAGYALLRRTGLARVSPNPDRRSLRTVGMDLPHVLSLTAQSSIGEEAVFRLLAVPVVLWLTGQPLLAALVAAVLWAGTHSGSMVRPRWIRFAELTLIGVTLGLVAIEIGIVAALVAHALYNLVVLSAPLLGVDSGRRRVGEETPTEARRVSANSAA